MGISPPLVTMDKARLLLSAQVLKQEEGKKLSEFSAALS